MTFGHKVFYWYWIYSWIQKPRVKPCSLLCAHPETLGAQDTRAGALGLVVEHRSQPWSYHTKLDFWPLGARRRPRRVLDRRYIYFFILQMIQLRHNCWKYSFWVSTAMWLWWRQTCFCHVKKRRRHALGQEGLACAMTQGPRPSTMVPCLSLWHHGLPYTAPAWLVRLPEATQMLPLSIWTEPWSLSFLLVLLLLSGLWVSACFAAAFWSLGLLLVLLLLSGLWVFYLLC